MADIAAFRASDGYEFYYRHYSGAKSRGRVIFVHGIRSHGGWYRRSCETIAAAGYEVDFLDRRGAGLNTAHRGDCPSFRRLLDDVGEFVRYRRRSRPWLPIVIAGISWGGKLAASLPYRAPGLVDAVALLCPGLCPRVRPALLERLRILRARALNPSRFFPIPLNEPELFTAARDWQRFIDQDRHGLRQATARFLFSSVSLDIYLKRALKHIAVPTLLMLAGDDRIIDNAATRRLFVTCAAPQRDIIDYTGAHHTLEFEEPSHPFVGDLVEWLKKHLA